LPAPLDNGAPSEDSRSSNDDARRNSAPPMMRLPRHASRRRALGGSRALALRSAEAARSGVSPAAIEVSLVDEDSLTRAGVRAILATYGELRLCAEHDQLEAAPVEPAAGRLRIFLVEATLACRSRGAALRAVRAASPQVEVLVFGSGTREEEIFHAFDAGAAGYLVRRDLATELGPAIRAVERGEKYVPSQVAERLRRREKRPSLTPRESDVLAMMAEARSNATIAAVLGISVGTVKLHVRAVLAKLGAEDRVEAAVLARTRGFVAGL